jgi:spermidine synthase
MDARVFIERSDQQYEYIFMDTFNSGLYIPAHLTTLEYWQAVRERLTPDGLLMINFIGARGLTGLTLTNSFAQTLKTVFPNAQAFVMDPAKNQSLQNIVFIADRTDEPLSLAGASVRSNTGVDHSLGDLAVSLSAPNPEAHVTFTDDRSPADYLVAKQLAATINAR